MYSRSGNPSTGRSALDARDVRPRHRSRPERHARHRHGRTRRHDGADRPLRRPVRPLRRRADLQRRRRPQDSRGHGRQEQAILQIDSRTYPDTPITRTLGGLPSLFVIACPLEISKKLPEGVTAEPIVELPVGPDYWGDTNVFAASTPGQTRRGRGSSRGEPVPLAAAATRKSPAASRRPSSSAATSPRTP